jgi:hypothetical protein
LRSNFHKGKVHIPKYKEHKRFYKKAIEMPVYGKEKIKAGNNRPGIKGANRSLTLNKREVKWLLVMCHCSVEGLCHGGRLMSSEMRDLLV